MVKPLALVLAGNTPAYINDRCGNFDDMFVKAAGLERIVYTTIRVSEGEQLSDPAAYSAVIITGSHAMVTDNLPWSVATEQWLRQAFSQKTPLFGVCYGHQLLARALGGTVEYHPKGMETGTLTIRHTGDWQNDALCVGLPAAYTANLSHSQTVVTLPDGASVLAVSDHDAHQMIRYGDSAWSVQFHPEFDGAIMRVYLDYARLKKPQLSLPKTAEDTPVAQSLLQRFVQRFSHA